MHGAHQTFIAAWLLCPAGQLSTIKHRTRDCRGCSACALPGLSPLKLAQHSRCFPSGLANVESDDADVSHALLCYSIKRDVRASEQTYKCNFLASSTSSASDCFRTVPMFATIDWARCGNLPTAGAQSRHAVMLRLYQSARFTMCLPCARLCQVPAWTRQRYLRRAGQLVGVEDCSLCRCQTCDSYLIKC